MQNKAIKDSSTVYKIGAIEIKIRIIFGKAKWQTDDFPNDEMNA
jgi:hypothetical protein